MFNISEKQKNGVSLLWVIVIVVIVSISLVTLSFIIFLNSNSYNTVKQISAATNSLDQDDLEGYDTTSPIQPKDLNVYSRTLDARVKNFNDSEAFSNEIISEEALGY